MEFWPIYIIFCCSFLMLGRGQTDYMGYAPTLAAIVAGVTLMRYTNLATGQMNFIFGPIDRVAVYSAGVWFLITVFVAIQEKYLAAFLLGISTIAYLPFMIANIGITRLGVAAVASDIPLVLAILACGNGVFGNPILSSFTRLGAFAPSFSAGSNMAEGKARVAKDLRGDG